MFVGTAERAEIIAVRLSDLRSDTIALPFAHDLRTQHDVDAELAIRIASSPPDWRAGLEREFAAHAFPDTLPPYANLVVDSEGMLWVQGYPRASAQSVRWAVIDPEGGVVAHATLPTWLKVFEIGRDYVLGRYIDPVEAIPQVRLYTLHRR